MGEKGSHKPADDSSLNNSSSEQADLSDGKTDEALSQSANEEIIARSGDGNGAGKMATNTLMETEKDSDWIRSQSRGGLVLKRHSEQSLRCRHGTEEQSSDDGTSKPEI